MENRPLVGMGVLIFNNKNEILLGERINAHGEGSWAPPGGHLETSESFEICAIREVFEETSLDVVNPVFFGVTNDIFEAENKHYVSVFMRCNFPDGQILQNMEPHKIREWKWFDWNHLPENLFLSLRNLKESSSFRNFA